MERGPKRVFAGALDWPGWCRSGKDEDMALAALQAYGRRYAAAVGRARRGFRAAAASDFDVVERLEGNATTDFGAPGAIPASDERPLDADDLRRQLALLRACWAALDEAVATAHGRSLMTGARGGGRSLAKTVDHVLDAEAGYLRALPWKAPSPAATAKDPVAAQRATVAEALAAVAPIGQPEPGPRGGRRWLARYFVRRDAWHVLDHAWEIEDRTPDR